MKEDIKKSKTIGIILGIIVFLILVGGATYAWLTWRSNNIAIGGSSECFNIDYTISREIGTQENPANIRFLEDYTEGEYAEVSLSINDSCVNVGGKGKIYLTTNAQGTSNAILTGGLYYTLTSITNNRETVIKEEAITSTNEILLLDDIFISTSSDDTKYRVYIWINGPLKDNNDNYVADSTYVDATYAGSIRAEIVSTESVESAARYISNLYKNATKTQHTDSIYNITYNYAEDVNLMNDREASMSVDPDAGNIRYYGSDPDNYVSFNGDQTWRIIGVFNGRLKIIQNYIGGYSYDTSAFDINLGYGVNQWGESTHSTDDSVYDGSDLMKLLNPGYNNNTDSICSTTLTDGRCGENDESLTSGLVNNSLYWNAESGKCYTGRNYTASNCNFTSSGLKDDTSKTMIDEVTWNLGSLPISANPWDGNTTASRLYNWEHSDNSGIQCTLNNAYCSSDVRGTTTWVGKVGLMSPSDYAYATGGGTTHNLNTCLSTHNAYVSDNSIQNWSNTYTDCKDNDWLLDKSSWQWTISPRAYSSNSYGVFLVTNAGYVYSNCATYAGRVRPVVYLKSSVGISGGNGTQSNPYVLSLS